MTAFPRILILSLLVFSTFSVNAEIALQNMQGKPEKLADYTGKGQWTVVILWASDCHVCNAEAEQYIQFHEAHKSKDAQILGLSLDGQEKLDAAKDFMKRHDVTYPSLIGEPQIGRAHV